MVVAMASERPGVMSFSPIVSTPVRNKMASMGLMAARGAASRAPPAEEEDKENAHVNAGAESALMRAPKAAEALLINMKKEMESARSFVREVSAGKVGGDGPYFSPCRAAGADTGDKPIKAHPLYRLHVGSDEEYEMLLRAQPKMARQEPAKEAALQRTVNLKLRQAAQELLSKRNTLAEKLCRLDDSFTDKERAYRTQVQSLTQQVKKEQASRVRAESQAETYKTAAETQTANVSAVAEERNDLLAHLEKVQAELNSRADMDMETREQLSSLACVVNAELADVVQQLSQALQEAQVISENKEALQADLKQQLNELNARYTDDVDILRMQMDEMSEAREEEMKRSEAQILELQQGAEQMQSKNAELQEELDVHTRKIEEKDSQIHSAMTELATLRAESESSEKALTAEIALKAEEISSHISAIAGLHATQEDLHTRLEASAVDLSDKQTELEAIQAKLSATSSELGEALTARERELQMAQAALDARTTQLTAAEASLAEKESALQQEQECVEKVQTQAQQLQQALKDLGCQSDELQKNLEVLQQERDGLQSALESTQAALLEEQAQHTAACEQGTALQQALTLNGQALQDEQQGREAAEKAHADANAALCAQIAQLQADAAALEKEAGIAADRHAAAVAQLEEQLRTKTDESKDLGADVQRRQEREDMLQETLRKTESSAASLQTKTDALEEKVGDLREKLAVAESKLQASELDVGQRQERETKLQSELSAIKTQQQELTHAFDAKAQELLAAQQDMAAFSESASTEQQSLLAKIAAADSAEAQLKEELAGSRAELKQASELLAKTSAAMQAKDAEATLFKQKLEEHQRGAHAAAEESKASIAALHSQLEDAKAAGNLLDGEKKELRWKLEAQEDRAADLKEQLAGVQQQLDLKANALASLDSENQEAKLEIARLTAERGMQEAKLDEIKTTLQEKDAQIDNAMKTLQQMEETSSERSKEAAKQHEAEMQRSKDDLMLAHRELDSIKKTVADLESKNWGAENEKIMTDAEIESLRGEVEELSGKVDRVTKEKAAASERLAALEAEYKVYKNLADTPGDLMDQLNKLAMLEADKAAVSSRLNAAEEDLENNKELVGTLKEQVKGLKQKLARAENTRRKLHNELQECKGNIRVFARVRPAEERCVMAVDEHSGEVKVPYNGVQHAFTMDRAFNLRSSQEDVFAEVSQFVQSSLDGFNVSLFAYGQTGSGKTHTMFGSSPADLGIIPRSIKQILETVEEQKENNWEYALEASFLEIYQEQVFDLLCPEGEREGRKYTIVAGENGRNDVTDLEWRTVRSQEDVEQMLQASQRNKHVAKTDMNERSSRSHTVFSLRISGLRDGGGGQVQTLHGTLHLVDLAGSERLAKSNATGERLKETQAINKSLSALSDVFVAISKHQAHVPYRNSKLTFLLQPCLSGDGKALMIANCSPVEASAHESLCTLRFASMVSSCELGKATKHISNEKNTVANKPEHEADFETIQHEVEPEDASATAPAGSTKGTRGAATARPESARPVRATRAAAAKTDRSTSSVSAGSCSARTTRAAAKK